MFIAMNRFTVDSTQTSIFEEVWAGRERNLSKHNGFVEFKLIKNTNSKDEETTLYISHVIWNSEEDFKAWVNSEEFKASHRNSKMPKGVIKSHPNFEGFEVILSE